jgi:hypothetical protein
MELDYRALPLTRRQLDTRLPHETAHSGAGWRRDLFVRIEGTVKRDLLVWAIRQALQEAEPLSVTFSAADRQVFHRTIDYSDLELAFYDLRGSPHPVQEAREIASSIQRRQMPFTDPLLKFALFRTEPDEYYWFTSCHHIVGGLSIALLVQRIAAFYSAIVSGTPIPPAFFGSSQDLVSSKLECKLSTDYLEDQAYWGGNPPSESGPDSWLPPASGERDPVSAFCAEFKHDYGPLGKKRVSGRG